MKKAHDNAHAPAQWLRQCGGRPQQQHRSGREIAIGAVIRDLGGKAVLRLMQAAGLHHLMRLRPLEAAGPVLGFGRGNDKTDRHRNASASGQEVADRASQRDMQTLRSIRIDPLVAAFEGAVIGAADAGGAGDLLLREAKPLAQLAQPAGIARRAGFFRGTATGLHRADLRRAEGIHLIRTYHKILMGVKFRLKFDG